LTCQVTHLSPYPCLIGLPGRRVIPFFDEDQPAPNPEDLCLDWSLSTYDLSQKDLAFTAWGAGALVGG